MLRRATQKHEHRKIVAYIHANFQPMTAEEVRSSHILQTVEAIERERRILTVIVSGISLVLLGIWWGDSLLSYMIIAQR